MKNNYRIVAQNRKANYEYFIEQEYNAGIVLQGSEIKSLRTCGANIQDSHIELNENELYIHNLNIAQYRLATVFRHEPSRKKKLLLNRKEINKIGGKIKLKGFTCIPLVLYINDKNYAKLKIAVAKGKKLYDKRQSIRDRENKREEMRIVKERIVRTTREQS
ncbi:MAG: SsrA-binding protein SmpB [Holosporaceae bacterium]|jgi:SsrA-binding protein|nr:SsrA-binding protein SmpB [Holosporaceae bacterium]